MKTEIFIQLEMYLVSRRRTVEKPWIVGLSNSSQTWRIGTYSTKKEATKTFNLINKHLNKEYHNELINKFIYSLVIDAKKELNRKVTK